MAQVVTFINLEVQKLLYISFMQEYTLDLSSKCC